MKLETPQLKMKSYSSFYRHEGKAWICRDELEEVFGPVAGDIMLVGSSQPTKGSVKILISVDDGGDAFWARPYLPDAREILCDPLVDFVREFLDAGHETIYVRRHQFEQDAPGMSQADG